MNNYVKDYWGPVLAILFTMFCAYKIYAEGAPEAAVVVLVVVVMIVSAIAHMIAQRHLRVANNAPTKATESKPGVTWLHVHRYSNWTVFEQYKRRTVEGNHDVYLTVQHRKCLVCDYEQLKMDQVR